MPMKQEHEYILEKSRDDKIKALGFLCYNLYVDGVMVFPEMNDIVDSIQKLLNQLLVLRQGSGESGYIHMHEVYLDEKLTELGCICYNLYVDSKLFNHKILALCDSISSINHEITNGLKTSSADMLYSPSYRDSEEPKVLRQPDIDNRHKKFDVNCPYGMEPIPVDFKKCQCGYRNKPEARFCGKCGAKLL